MPPHTSGDRTTSATPPAPVRIRAYHPGSGNVLTGDAVRVVVTGEQVDYQLIPDGLLESVVIRGGVWQVTELPAA